LEEAGWMARDGSAKSLGLTSSGKLLVPRFLGQWFDEWCAWNYCIYIGNYLSIKIEKIINVFIAFDTKLHMFEHSLSCYYFWHI
jgi:hypothetical protein